MLPPEPSREEAAMSTASEKIRCAFGLFRRVPDLAQAVRELRAAGLAASQMRVIVPPKPDDSGSRWREVVPNVGVDAWIVSEARGACPWDFTPLHLAPSQQGSAPTKRDVIPDFHVWTLERHAQQLDRHLRSGGAIIVVEIKADGDERATHSILLRYATAGVQTHEISRPHRT
jgi:hypothetical protein